MAAGSTRSVFHLSFARDSNIADVTAKGEGAAISVAGRLCQREARQRPSFTTTLTG